MNRRGFISTIPFVSVPMMAAPQPKTREVLTVPQLYCSDCGSQLWQEWIGMARHIRKTHTVVAWCLNDSEFHPCPLANVKLEVKLQTLPAKEVKDGNR